MKTRIVQAILALSVQVNLQGDMKSLKGLSFTAAVVLLPGIGESLTHGCRSFSKFLSKKGFTFFFNEEGAIDVRQELKQGENSKKPKRLT